MEDNNNNLEKFFQYKFNQKIEPQDWNIPDNEMWDSIVGNIPSENKKRRLGILPYMLVAGLSVLSFILGYDNYRKRNCIAALHQELKECSNQVSISNKVNTSPQKFVGSTAALSNGSQNKEVKILNSNNEIVESLENTPNYKSINKNSNASRYLQQQKNTPFIVDPYPIAEEKNLSSNETVLILNERIGISSLPIHTYELVKGNDDLLDINFPIITEFNKPIKKSTGIMQIAAVLRYINWQDKIKGSFTNPLSELLIKEETAPSLSFVFAFGKTIGSHLVLNTGMLYYQRNQTSQYAIDLPYSITNEINVGSEFENRFEHSLPTGLGNINTRLVLSRSINSPVANNENVHLDFSLQNHTKALAVPLTMSYYLKEAGEGFFVQGGLMNEFIIENKIRAVNTESHHTFVKDKSIVVNYNASQINKVNISTIFGIGYQKEIFNGLGISLSANYGFALTNTFATPEYQHKIDHMGVQMMVVKNID